MDREWKRVVVARGLQLLREECKATGRETEFKVFEAYYFDPRGEDGHEAVAARFGLTTADVNNHLTGARRRFRRHVYGIVAQSVTDVEGFRLEIRELFGPEGVP